MKWEYLKELIHESVNGDICKLPFYHLVSSFVLSTLFLVCSVKHVCLFLLGPQAKAA